MKRLTKEHVIMLHSQIVERTGGVDGVRDFGLLESAIENPFQAFGGVELYPTIQEKGARLGYGLIKNHCMLDGNKRIGVHAMLVFLELNGVVLNYGQEELYKMVLAVAASIMSYEELHGWVLEHQAYDISKIKD